MSLFNPVSLYDQCKRNVLVNHVFDFEKLAGTLPKSIYEELIQDWLRCDETLDFSDDVIDEMYSFINDSDLFCSDNTWDKPSFLMRRCILGFSQEMYENYPEFHFIHSNTYNHINIEYYIKGQVGLPNRLICAPCFRKTSQYELPFSKELWARDNIYYSHLHEHSMVHADDVYKDIIKRKMNWCDLCYIEPFFRITDPNECDSTGHLYDTPIFNIVIDDYESDHYEIYDVKGNSNPSLYEEFKDYF